MRRVPLAGSALASLLLGAGTGTLTIPNQPKQTSKYYAWYIADDWKVTSRLTLNIGFRYGLDVPFIDRYNRFAIFNPNAISPLAASSGLPNLKGGLEFPGVNGYPRRVVSTNFSGWDPRFGFAYRAWKNTVLRGGFGIFHVPSLEQAQGNQNSTGFAGLSSFVSAANGILPTDFLSNPFQGGLVPATGSSQGLLTGVGTAVSGPALRGDNRLPYVEQWNFNVQQQLPGEIRVEAGYVGGHSVFLSFPAWNFNQLRPEQLSAALQQQVRNPFFGQITNGPLSTATVPLGSVVAPFPQYQSLTLAATSGAFSTYEAFQLKVEKRFGSGASFLLSYASQKLLDNNSATGIGPNAAIQNIYNVIAEKSVSAGSIAQSLSFSYTYELPFGTGKPIGKSWGRALNYALGGWQTNGIATFQTGVPLAVTAPNTSGSGSSVLRPNNNGNSAKLSGPTNRRLDQYFNTSVFSQPAPFTFGNTARTLSDVRAPGVKNFDLSVFKNFRPVERMTVQFRAEAFNSFNRVQFAAPNSVLNSGQFGVISAQANTPRQIQFGIKLLF